MDIYKTILLDHYRSPRNREPLEDPDFQSQVCNPSCGDSVIMYGRAQAMTVVTLAFRGAGCVISQATASLLTEHVRGMKIEAIQAITAETVLDLIGMELGPIRLKCALLPLDALKQALVTYETMKKGESNVESNTPYCSNGEGI